MIRILRVFGWDGNFIKYSIILVFILFTYLGIKNAAARLKEDKDQWLVKKEEINMLKGASIKEQMAYGMSIGRNLNIGAKVKDRYQRFKDWVRKVAK